MLNLYFSSITIRLIELFPIMKFAEEVNQGEIISVMWKQKKTSTSGSWTHITKVSNFVNIGIFLWLYISWFRIFFSITLLIYTEFENV